MTSAFSWQNSISLCAASFCTSRPNLSVTPGVSWLPTFAFHLYKKTIITGLPSGVYIDRSIAWVTIYNVVYIWNKKKSGRIPPKQSRLLLLVCRQTEELRSPFCAGKCTYHHEYAARSVDFLLLLCLSSVVMNLCDPLDGSLLPIWPWFLSFFSILQMCVCVLVAQSRRALCDPMDCSPPDDSVHGILQARILEWITVPFSRLSTQLRVQTWVSRIANRFLTI